MSISVDHKYAPTPDTLTIHISGEFKGIEAHDFEKNILAEIQTGKARKIVYDFSGVTYLDSAALEFLFKCAKTCKEAGQSIRISNPRPNISKLFDILRVDRIIPIEYT